MSVSGMGRGSGAGYDDRDIAGAEAPGVALGRALTNDPRGVVDAKDAKALVDRAIAEIAAAPDPEKAFKANERAIGAAKALADGRGAANVLAAFATRGREAVQARQAEIANPRKLPAAARDAFVRFLREHEIVGGSTPVKIEGAHGDPRSGYEFTYTAGRTKGTGFAMERGGGWFFAPKPVTPAQLDKVTAAYAKYFDKQFGPELRVNGLDAAKIRAMRDRVVPEYAFFPGAESDPYDYTKTYPLVFSLRNPIGSDHGFYAGFDPATGKVDCYDFN